jgi:hypothetical protein
MNQINDLLLKSCLVYLMLTNTLSAMCQQKQLEMDQLAERFNAYTDHRIQASVYLRTSKDTYESMEDLWFKAFVLDAQSTNIFGADRTLYVRLVRKDIDSVVWEEKYQVKNGMVNGHIYLDEALPEGDYYLSAYSAHAFFRGQPFSSLKWVKLIRQTKALLHDNASSVIAAMQQQRKIQFSLLPEGGHIVSGLKNRVAFKAVGERGEPLEISGKLFRGNTPINEFRSIHAGMGSFYFTPVPGASYHIRLDGLTTDTLYALPLIKEKGFVINLINNESNGLVFNIYQSHGAVAQTIFLRLQIRGRIQLIASGVLKDSLKVKIPTVDSPQGIAEVTLLDQEERPLAERLVYLNPEKSLNITASLSKARYKRREKVFVNIKTSDEHGNPVAANVAVSVYDQIYHNAQDAKDILTHYYLSTQLKGRIYDPAYYFNVDNKDCKEAMDLLLLTQGWRCYLWNEEELKETNHWKPVLSDSTKGRLKAVNSKKNKPNVQVLMAFSTDESEKRTLFTDSLGNFTLGPEDFVKGRWNYLKRFDLSNAEYTTSVEDPFKAISDVSRTLQVDYPLAGLIITDKKEAISPSRLSVGTINLNEVKIVAKKGSGFRDRYMGHLDSLAKFEGNTDFIAPNSSWLNVPVNYGGTRPVEGQKYITWNGPDPPTSHPFSFNSTNSKYVIYHYPKFTEEDLLKKFKLTRIKGYYEQREFYQPNYDKEPNSAPDYRNTLLWAPDVITNKNGQATLEFFCSDINSSFQGIIEGVGGAGLVGKAMFYFSAK